MSRQKDVVTTYNKNLIFFVAIIAAGFLITVVFLVFSQYFLSTETTDQLTPNPTPRKHLTESPTPTKIIYPTINIPTPTPLPTLTEEQHQQLMDELKNLPFQDGAEEGLNELQNLPLTDE